MFLKMSAQASTVIGDHGLWRAPGSFCDPGNHSRTLLSPGDLKTERRDGSE